MIGVKITENGTIFGIASTPPAGSVGWEMVTAEWFRLSNCVVRTVIETYINGSNWYRVWSDGWKEQGGVAAAGGSVTVTFPKAFTNTNYTACATSLGNTGDIYAQCINKSSATEMVIANTGGSTTLQKSWYACGY